MKTKDEVANVFKIFHTIVQTQFGGKVQIHRSDNGGEYINQHLKEYFLQHGLLHETSCSGTPQQKGVAKKKNGHILETAWSLLFENNVPHRFWDNAVATAVHLIN